MTLLAAIAMLCCCAIPLIAVVLALQVRRSAGFDPEASQEFKVRLKTWVPVIQPSHLRLDLSADLVADRPAVLVSHPRLDLAAGLVPARQVVDRTRRQHRGTPLPARPRRLDLVYARAEMGDLSDPDTRRAVPFSSHGRATRADVVAR